MTPRMPAVSFFVSMPKRGARFVPMPIGSEILIFQDPSEADTWRVEYFDFKGECYLTRFSGPAAERRARDYVLALHDRIIRPL